MSNRYNDLLVSQMPERLDTEKNAALYLRVAAGDAAAREEMIAGNMPLALTNVESFIGLFPEMAHARDELASAAFIGLVKAVNKMAAGKGPRKRDLSAPVEFLGMWINREIRKAVEYEKTIHLPETSKYRARAQGEELTVPPVVNDIPERFEIPSYEEELEIRDLIDSCCTCDEERTFVAMRETNRTLDQIAAAIGMSRTSLCRMKKELKARVDRKLEALRDQ